VCPQSFGFRQRHHRAPQPGEPLARELLHGNRLDEIRRAQPAPHARRARRRQDVIRPGSVIARRHGAVTTQENGTGGLNPREQSDRIVQQRQMLRREGVRELGCFLQIPGQNDGSLSSQGFLRDGQAQLADDVRRCSLNL